MFNQKSELVHKTDCSAIVCSIFPLAKWIENNSLMPGYFCKHITEYSGSSYYVTILISALL